ncbi:MAG: hypothetical protein ACFBSE_13480 [Prochloraceae cyanobacterium]
MFKSKDPFTSDPNCKTLQTFADTTKEITKNRSDSVAITAIYTLGLVIISITFISVAGFVIVQLVSNFYQRNNYEIIQP